MRTKEAKESKNLQVSRERLPDKALAKLVKEAEKGPFMTLEEHHKKMDTGKLPVIVSEPSKKNYYLDNLRIEANL